MGSPPTADDPRAGSTPDVDAPSRSARDGGRSRREQVLAARLLIVVGAAYLVAQLVLIPFSRPPGWDESVYLSQVMPGVDALAFLAWRARGITLLVAPVTWLGGSVADVRLFLMLASAVAMTAAFRLWVPLVGLAAPIGAALFSFSWLGVLGGSEVMPNLWAAILGLATAGLVARRVDGGRLRDVVLASALLGAMALVRPTEAAVAAGAIGLFVIGFRRAYWRVVFALGLGLALGWLAWFAEMSVRFGGPVSALRAAATEHFARAPFAYNVAIHIGATDGDLKASRVPIGGVIWWGLLVALGIVACVRASRVNRTATILASLGAVALTAEYLVFVSALAPRFLLPAYAFASLLAAIGIISLLRGAIVPRVLGGIVLLLVVPWAIWQGGVAGRYLDQRMRSTVAFHDIGRTIRGLANGAPCSVLSPHGYPMVAFASGCDGAELPRPRGPTAAELRRRLVDRDQVFVILKGEATRGSPLAGISAVRVPGPAKAWFLYRVSDSPG